MKPYYERNGIAIYHADCRDILPQIKTGSVDLVLTDPPYGIGKRYGDSYNDRADGYWEWFVPVVSMMRACAPLVAFTHRLDVLKHITDWDWIAAWHKPMAFGARIGNSPVLPHWEPIILFGIHTLGTKREAFPDVLTFNPERGGASGQRYKSFGKKVMGRETNNLQIEGEHPLPKPIKLFTRLISILTTENQIVCDPFMGSGTTLVAAKQLGRRAIGIEIEERYCEIAANRLAQEVLSLSDNPADILEQDAWTLDT